jgi:hypothetical protein
MRKLLLSTFLLTLGLHGISQCTPDASLVDGPYGVWPDTTANFAFGALTAPYYQQLNVLIPSDAGQIDPLFTGVPLDSVHFTGIDNLPPGLSVVCASQTGASCTYLADQLGCGVIQGTPTQAGIYPLVLNVTAFINLGGNAVPVTRQFTGYRITISEAVGIAEMPSQALASVKNVPNPFASRTSFEFQMARASEVDIRVFNLLGEELWAQKVQAKAGQNKIPFDGGSLPEGVYLYKVESGKESFTGRMVLNR